MTAILGGVGAAFCWAGATLCSSRSSREIGASSVLAWVMLVGCCSGNLASFLLQRNPWTRRPEYEPRGGTACAVEAEPDVGSNDVAAWLPAAGRSTFTTAPADGGRTLTSSVVLLGWVGSTLLVLV